MNIPSCKSGLQGDFKKSMFSKFFEINQRLHDTFRQYWESPSGRYFQGNLLIVSFLGSIILVEASLRGMIPEYMLKYMPVNHLSAINITFTLLLMFEGVGLALNFVASVSESVSRQFEIFSLILIRDVFKMMSHLDEPMTWNRVSEIVPDMAVLSVSALVIYILMGFYSKLNIRVPVIRDEDSRSSFIRSKELVSMFLLVSFIVICATDVWNYISTGKNETIFHSFFTLLAFTDILMVLVSLKYGNIYALAFRDSAFAAATVMVRMALVAPPIYGAIIGSGSSLFVICVIIAYNRFASALMAQCQKDDCQLKRMG